MQMKKEELSNRELSYLYSRLPSVDKVLNNASLTDLLKSFGHVAVRDCARTVMQRLREQAAAGELSARKFLLQDNIVEAVCVQIRRELDASASRPLRKVLNLTGIVLHSNLGRSLLSEQAISAMTLAARHNTDLEFDLGAGKRGERESYLERLLCELTGAEAATVVNNNAAAVVLTLQALARGQEVLLSRGELVEIGASFRIPEVMESAGCQLREVGSSNRTHLSDYANAICADTAVLMQVHTSNYCVAGFASSVSTQELSALAQAHDLPLVHDLGSGTLLDLSEFGVAKEPTVKELLCAGADVLTFSGDKLLGGPQAGLIVGKKKYIDIIRRHPLKRALRMDKLGIAALEQVLMAYRSPGELAATLPNFRFLTRPKAQIEEQARRLLPAFDSFLGGQFEVSVEDCESEVGSGALPGNAIPSACIAISPRDCFSKEKLLQNLSAELRRTQVPVIGRLKQAKLLLDLRCLENEAELIAQLEQLNLSSLAS
ncbi:MAG: L-seryl-tRNA(Sec) selenium transferase [Pseudohongiellaceae bacterium]|nr:L-seryl-tRNA(Sec) selenium transferase [Pseudohongiellaceae bacterium]